MANVARMRTVKSCVEFFKQQDSSTSLTEYYLNTLVKQGIIPVFHAGRKRLVNLDKLIEYLNGEAIEPEKDSTYGGIRRVIE